MSAIPIYISPDTAQQELIKHTLNTVFFNKGLSCTYTLNKEEALLTIGYSDLNDFVISENHHRLLSQNIFGHQQQLSHNGNIVNKFGGTDFISTISYLINSFQEYNDTAPDQYGRFKYTNSVQHKLNSIENNTVQQIIDHLFGTHPKLRDLKTTSRKSRVFLTHDIDSVYGAVKEDGRYALEKFKPIEIIRLLFNATLGKPDWLNMSEIMKIEQQYGFTSTFYWLLVMNKQNSDYHFKLADIQQEFEAVKTKGWENGLHKAMGDSTFSEEIKTFGSIPKGNRYHFLKFTLPAGYDLIEENGLQLDTSLGFSPAFGLRNSYGLPFVPFNLKQNRPYHFVEAPQLMMDRTFYNLNMPVAEVKKKFFDFVERNQYNCVFTINWHNNFFTDLKYNGYRQLYQDIMAGLKERGIEGIKQSQIIEEYYKQ